MLEPSDLVQLPKGQAFALIHGGQLHKIRMPLPDASHDPLMPDEPGSDREALRAASTGHGIARRQWSALSIPDTVVRRSYRGPIARHRGAMVGTQLLGVRAANSCAVSCRCCCFCTRSAPPMASPERAIRRACGGRESASLYHRAKYLQLAVLGLGGVALLMWPGPVMSLWRVPFADEDKIAGFMAAQSVRSGDPE
jgi:hypothetical protein